MALLARSPASNRAGSPGIRCEIINVITQTPATTSTSPQQRWRKILQKVTLFTHGIDIEDLFQHGIEHKAFHLFVHRQLVVFLEQVHISSVINDDFLCLLVVPGTLRLVGGRKRIAQ